LKTLAIIGGGSWGTALAIVLAPRFPTVRLWVYEAVLAARMQLSRENDLYLAGRSIPKNVEITSDLAAALASADIVLSAVPSHLVRSIYSQMLPLLAPSMIFASATKGLETDTLLRVSEVIAEVLAPAFPPRLAVLSGPTFAREVACGDPTALVVASADPTLAETLQAAFSGPTFRL
jgi:glycerol-3-phosphate dehydrogenase (NAD(P)+)